MDDSFNNAPNPIMAGIKAGLMASIFIMTLQVINFLLLRVILLYLYPLQLLAYFIAGRTGGGMALRNDEFGAVFEINTRAVGGAAGATLCVISWLLVGLISVASSALGLTENLELVFWTWLLCFAIDLPVAIGIGSLGGSTKNPENI